MKNKKTLAFRGGSYSILITIIVLAILIVVNVCVSALPATATKFDISSTKLYSVTSNTKAVLNKLQNDVRIYWIVQANEDDAVISNLLDKYESLSDHIEVIKKNPDVYPTFAEQYTTATVANNSLVVECGDRYRYIPYSDIYVSTQNMYSYSYSTSFDGEGAITSAIDYVVSEELPQVYCLEGHGEGALPSNFSDQIEKENIELQTLSLLTVDEISEDAACLLLYAPQSDLSSEEAKMLLDYVNNGGKLLVIAGPVENESFENLKTILAAYSISVEEGVIVEADRDHYAFQRPFILLPDMETNTITDPIIEASYFPIMPIAAGLVADESNVRVATLLSTSEDSFSKIAGYGLTTYEKEEGDIDGPFAVAVSISAPEDGKLVWFSSAVFLEDEYNAYSSGANTDLAMNALSALIGEREAMAIRSKSLNYNYLTISETEGSMLKAVLIVILPLAYLGVGIVVYVRTRRKQNEAR